MIMIMDDHVKNVERYKELFDINSRLQKVSGRLFCATKASATNLQHMNRAHKKEIKKSQYKGFG